VQDKRHYLIRKAAELKELGGLETHLRDEVADACLKMFSKMSSIQILETTFWISLCIAGPSGLIVGFLEWRFWGALLVMASFVFASCGFFAIVFRLAWKKWLKRFMTTDEFKALLSKIESR